MKNSWHWIWLTHIKLPISISYSIEPQTFSPHNSTHDVNKPCIFNFFSITNSLSNHNLTLCEWNTKKESYVQSSNNFSFYLRAQCASSNLLLNLLFFCSTEAISILMSTSTHPLLWSYPFQNVIKKIHFFVFFFVFTLKVQMEPRRKGSWRYNAQQTSTLRA